MSKIFGFVALLVLLLGGVVYWGMQDGSSSDVSFEASPKPTYFYGEACPHCKEVAKFLEENQIAEKVDFVKKEVWSDKTNAKEMKVRAEACGIEPSGMGVPFLYADGKCFIGVPDVTKFFKKAAGME